MSIIKAHSDPLMGLEWGSEEWMKEAGKLGIQVRLETNPVNQEEPDTVLRPWKHKHFSTDKLYDRFSKVDVPGYMKKIREELLGLTMEGLAEIMGISKGHIAKLEGGKVFATTTIQLVFWDIVERALRNKGMEWNQSPAAPDAEFLTGEEAVDHLVPDAYKKRRNWQSNRNLIWPYSKSWGDSDGAEGLVVVGYSPPMLQTHLSEDMDDRLLASLEGQKSGAAEIGEKVLGGSTFDFLKGPHALKFAGGPRKTLLTGGLLNTPLSEDASKLEKWTFSKANKDGAAEAIYQDPPFNEKMSSVMEAAKKHGDKVKQLAAEKEELLANLKIQNATLEAKVEAFQSQMDMKDVVIKSKDELIEQLRERISEMKVMSMVVPEANLVDQPIDKPKSK